MSCTIHNVKFYNFDPKSVICISHNSKLKKLAVARNDNSIEIWNIANSPFIENIIVAQSDNSIEAVLWIDSRLFSCGLQGMITEYDTITFTIKKDIPVTGGAAWCMDISHDGSRLAIGTEDGYINTYFVTEESLIYEKILDKQKGRILCIKWDRTGQFLYTGGIDAVRIWNVSSGNAIHKMLTSRKEAKKETIVWCLEVTSDNMIISGDSRGVLSIWDPNMGILVESYESHIADILTVCLSKDLSVIYCAGVDPVIRTFSRVVVKNTGRIQWVRGVERRIHVHDVRSLVEVNGKLYSSGVDGYLAQSSYPPKILIKYPPMLAPPCAYLCPKAKSILLRYQNALELWKLGSAKADDLDDNNKFNSFKKLQDLPSKLLTIHTKNEENIVSCAISSDYRTIVYSTNTHVRVFSFNVEEGEAELLKMNHDIPSQRIHKMLFSPNRKMLITANNDGTGNTITCYSATTQCLRFSGSFKTDKDHIVNVNLMCFSPDSKYLICSDNEGRIIIYSIKEDLNSESINSISLIKYECPATAMAVQKHTLNLLVVYANHKIVEFSIPQKRYTDFSRNLEGKTPTQWLARPYRIINILFDPNNENIIIMHDDTHVFVINKMADLPTDPTTKISKLDSSDSREDSSTGSSTQGQQAFQVIKKYKHLVFMDRLSNDELVAVEVTPESLIEKLPPVLKQKYFGT